MPIFNQGGKFFTTSENKMIITPWKPNRISGLSFWGDSDTKNIIRNGNSIDSWLDSSGKLNNAVQTITNKKPIYIENIINGFPSLYFQNVSMLNIPLYLNYFTIFTVITIKSKIILVIKYIFYRYICCW